MADHFDKVLHLWSFLIECIWHFLNSVSMRWSSLVDQSSLSHCPVLMTRTHQEPPDPVFDEEVIRSKRLAHLPSDLPQKEHSLLKNDYTETLSSSIATSSDSSDHDQIPQKYASSSPCPLNLSHFPAKALNLATEVVASHPSSSSSSEPSATPIKTKLHPGKLFPSKEQLISDIITLILNVTLHEQLKSTHSTSFSSNSPYYLRHLAEEFKADSKPGILAIQDIDSALIEQASSSPPSHLLSYFLECWYNTHSSKHLEYFRQMTRTCFTEHELVSLIQDIRRCIITQIYLLLLDEQSEGILLADKIESICRAELNVNSLTATVRECELNPKDIELLLDSMVSQITYEDAYPILVGPVTLLINRLSKLNILDDFLPVLRAVSIMFSSNSLRKLMINHPLWTAEYSTMFSNSIMAVLCNICGMLEIKISQEHFTPPSSSITHDFVNKLKDQVYMVRRYNSWIQDILGRIWISLMQDKECRHHLVAWVKKYIINGPWKRNSTMHQLHWISTPKLYQVDGLFFNLAHQMIRLCIPIAKKYALINAKCISHFSDSTQSSLFSIVTDDHSDQSSSQSSVTAISESMPNTLTQQNSAASESFNLTSVLFFTTHYAVHVSLVPILEHYWTLFNSLDRYQTEQRNIMNNQLSALITSTIGLIFNMQTFLLDPIFVNSTLQFYETTAKWLLHFLNQDENKISIHLIPEFIVDDMILYLLFLTKSTSRTNLFFLENIDFEFSEPILSLLIYILDNKTVRNHHLRGKIVELFAQYSCPHLLNPHQEYHQPEYRDLVKYFGHNFTALGPSLINLCCDVERTGSQNQFYEKFMIRNHISVLLRHLITQPGSREITCKMTRLPRFSVFLTFLLNDSLFFLDELLVKLRRNREIRNSMKDQTSWLAQPVETRTEIEQELETLQSHIESCAWFGQESILLLESISYIIPESLFKPEVLDALTTMLNFVLDHLASPKRKQLLLQSDHSKHRPRLNPRLLLSCIINIYLNCSLAANKQADPNCFLDALVREARSFKFSIFQCAIELCKTRPIVSSSTLEDLSALLLRLKERHNIFKEEEIPLEDIPEEFLDALLSTLMVDPITLPSGQIVDKATITRHLSGHDSTDPFTRQKLSPEMLVPNPELKQRIECWKLSLKSKSRQENLDKMQAKCESESNPKQVEDDLHR